MASITPIAASDRVTDSRAVINTNFTNLNNSKTEKSATIIPVGVAGQYETIQEALDNMPSTGGIVLLLDPTYIITSTLEFKTSGTEIVGNGRGTVISCNGATVTTLFRADTDDLVECAIRHVDLVQTNATVQGVAIDYSNMSLSVFENIEINAFGTAIKADDTSDHTFFNHVKDVKIFECNNGLDYTSTNPFNDNMHSNVRISLKAGGAGIGLKMTNGQQNSFYNLNVEPATGTGITGVSLTTANVLDTVFVGFYAENNATNISIGSGVIRTLFFGGTSTAAGSSNLTDNGINTTIYSMRIGSTYTSYTGPLQIIENSNATWIAQVIKNSTAFAHTASQLAIMQLLNASDSSTVLQLLNAGTGLTLDVQGGVATQAVTKTQLAANTNDYAIGNGVFFRMSTDAARNLTGIAGGLDGRHIIIRNVGAQNLVLKNADTNSAEANRFVFTTGADITIAANGSIHLLYDATTQRWFDVV